MNTIARGVVCAALVGTMMSPALSARAEHLNVTVYPSGTLTSPTVAQASSVLRQIPGGADVVPATKFKDSYAISMKDMLVSTPGVYAQPRWGEESRLSIRGSGLSRSFHLRGVMLLQDGIPFNFADGSGDFQEIDPLLLQHVEVYRGGQALRYGAASLGGAINMVTPTAQTTGYNALLRVEGGSFGTVRTHAEAAKIFNGADVFAAATKSLSDGYRYQSEQNNTRFSGNVGVKLGDNAETRFYLSWNDINQEVPGTIAKDTALHNPKNVPAINVLNDYARDIDSLRVANRTAFALGHDLKLEVGGYANDRSLYHPIFQVIDQESLDLGSFARLSGPWSIGDAKNDFVLGVNLGRGTNDAKRFVNVQGRRGALTADAKQIAKNVELYGENTLHFANDWNFILGLQANAANRDYTDYLNAANNADKTFHSLNPKIGVLWNVTPMSEVYASITRSSEVPTFSELVQGAPASCPSRCKRHGRPNSAHAGRKGASRGTRRSTTHVCAMKCCNSR